MKRLWRRPVFLSLLAALLVLGAGAWWWRISHAPALRLVKLEFSALPGWKNSDARAALAAFRRSCARILALPAAQGMGGAGYAGSARDWRAPCAAVPASPDAAAARNFFEHDFVPFAVRGREESLFTGYYEPEISGSHSRHGVFQTPVYARPDDLISVDLGQFSPRWRGEHTAGRVVGENLVPYAARAEIENSGLAQHAKILFFAADPIGVFFLQIQGSGRVRFEDGTFARVVYDGQNGRPYTAIGRTLMAQGALARAAVSLQSIRAWLLAHPALAAAVMQTDQSFVFFRQVAVGDPGLGAAGAQGANLTPEASLAVDPRLHALGAPFFVATEVPGAGTWDRLLIAQDIGGAIRGAVRGDIFFGHGKIAESRAGTMKSPGRLYVLLPVAVAARLGAAQDFPAPP